MSYKKLLTKDISAKKLSEYMTEDASKEKKFHADSLWYHGKNTNRKAAESILLAKDVKPGSFLIRDSYSSQGDYVLSLRHDKAKHQPAVEHYKINCNQNDSYYKLEKLKHKEIHGLENLIEFYCQENQGLVVKLEKCVGNGQPPPPESRKTGRTNILHQALLSGIEGNVLQVLQHKKCPNINAKDGEGTPALHIACKQGMVQVVDLMIQRQVKTTTRDMEGYTALHVACKYNQAAIVEALLDRAHCSVIAVCMHNRWTPLHSAAEAGNVDCARLLLNKGAPDRPRDSKQDIPYDLAKQNNRTDMIRYLDTYESAVPPTLRNKDWLHESITRDQAELLFHKLGETDGIFLVRKSSRGKNYALTLAFEQHTYHYEIKVMEGVVFYIDDGPLVTSLERIVYHYCRFKDGLPVRLKTAVTPDESLIDLNDFIQDEEGKLEPVSPGYGDDDAYDDVMSVDLSPEAPSTGTLPSAARPPPRRKSDPLMQMLISRKQIALSGTELGQGEFGSVLKGVYTHGGDGPRLTRKKENVAVKTLLESQLDNTNDFLQEARVMCGLNHPNIVRLIGICEGPPVMIIQELVKMGSMLDYLWDYEEHINPNTDLILWAAQIAKGMEYLEKRKFVHRDLAARNILLASKTKAKISDFGLSRAVNAGSDYYKASKGGRWPVKWYAPESVNYGTFSHASDVWSYGVTLYEMFSFGDQPYGEKSGSEVIGLLERGFRLEKPEKCPDDVYKLMRKCWSSEASERPSFVELTEHFDKNPKFSRVKSILNQNKHRR